MHIAIIPARGGSKRVPRKNIREFCGRPMIAWPIATALESGLFDHIIVSTDDMEIADVAHDAGAEVPFSRPLGLADDYTGTTDVIAHALSWAANVGWEVDAACCIYPTAAFILADDLRQAHQLLDQECDYAFAAVRYGHPPQRGFMHSDGGGLRLVQPEYENTRTQDLPPIYHDAGQFYWGKAAAWMERLPLFGSRARFIDLPPWRAQDIDREEDWMMAELVFKAIQAHGE